MVYGILLIRVLTLHDRKTSELVLNIVNHIINGLFTFAAMLNLPVRIVRLYHLLEERNIPFVRQMTRLMSLTALERTSTMEMQAESQLIFDHLSWGTKHIILQALLWNSLFQIINQVFRCVYYSYEMTVELPGKIWVNTFFPLAILASIVAALIQAIAENRFRDENSLKKRQNNCKKHLVEFWYNLWKVQTEGELALARQFSNHMPELTKNRTLHVIHLTPRSMEELTNYDLKELEIVDLSEEEPETCNLKSDKKMNENRKQQRHMEQNLGDEFLHLGNNPKYQEHRGKVFHFHSVVKTKQNEEKLDGEYKVSYDDNEGGLALPRNISISKGSSIKF